KPPTGKPWSKKRPERSRSSGNALRFVVCRASQGWVRSGPSPERRADPNGHPGPPDAAEGEGICFLGFTRVSEAFMATLTETTPITEMTSAVSEATPVVAVSPRNVAVDAYRGLVMLLMMAEVLELSRVSAAYPTSLFWKILAYNQTHVEWFGCSLHDTVHRKHRRSSGFGRRLAAFSSPIGWLGPCIPRRRPTSTGKAWAFPRRGTHSTTSPDSPRTGTKTTISETASTSGS